MATDLYNSGQYLAYVGDWHEADAPMKARALHALLARHRLVPARVLDVGCGTGGVLAECRTAWPEAQLVGCDIAASALELGRDRAAELRLEMHEGLLTDVDGHFDVLLALDVLEHVEDYLGFLRSLHGRADRFVFHIPLDLSAQALIRLSKPLLHARNSVGHLHYFTRQTALATLRSSGYEVVDADLLPAFETPSRQTLRTRVALLPRRLSRMLLGPDRAASVVGGHTLMVLARTAEPRG